MKSIINKENRLMDFFNLLNEMIEKDIKEAVINESHQSTNIKTSYKLVINLLNENKKT